MKIVRDIFRFQGFRGSIRLAAKGIIFLFLYHRNMRIIFMLGMISFLLGIYLELRGIELAILCVTTTLVFIAEIFNTAVEMMMNILTDKYHTKVRLIKDIAAAVVVLTCLNAVAIGYILFVRKLVK